MESWKGYNYYTANQTKWVELMNLSTSEWRIGFLPANVVAIPGPLNASYNFPSDTLVIENASQAEFGSRDIEKVIFGATSGLVLLWAFSWLGWNSWKGILLKPRGSSSSSSSSSPPSAPEGTDYLDGEVVNNTSALELGTMGGDNDGLFVTAKQFQDELDVYYENVRTELELYEKTPRIDGVDPEDVEAATELLRRMYETQLRIYAMQNSHEVTQKERAQMAQQSEALLADLGKLLASWSPEKQQSTMAAAAWLPEELEELKELGTLLRNTSGTRNR